jgi:ATP-binding cassette, subfamily B, multidrug efflux pump
LMKFMTPYRGRFITVILLTLLLGVLAPTRPVLIQYTLDKDVAVGNYDAMVRMMILLMVLLVINSIAQYVHTYLSGWLGRSDNK